LDDDAEGPVVLQRVVADGATVRAAELADADVCARDVVARDRGASPGRRGEDADCKFVPNGASVAGDWMIVEPAPLAPRRLRPGSSGSLEAR
jgi:hypothetical protein